MPPGRSSGDGRCNVRWLRGRSDGVMQEDQSGSESQQPEYVGPWSPLANEPDPPGEAGGSPSPETGPGQPGDTAPLAGSGGSSDGPEGQPTPHGSEPTQPVGYGQPGQ